MLRGQGSGYFLSHACTCTHVGLQLWAQRNAKHRGLRARHDERPSCPQAGRDFTAIGSAKCRRCLKVGRPIQPVPARQVASSDLTSDPAFCEAAFCVFTFLSALPLHTNKAPQFYFQPPALLLPQYILVWSHATRIHTHTHTTHIAVLRKKRRSNYTTFGHHC